MSSADYIVINDAFIATAFNGSAGFRFKDRFDFSATASILGTSDGSVDEEMQLSKTYTFGSVDTERPIKKPVNDNFQLYEDGVPLASSLDTTTGIVTFTSTVGKVITADFEFDVPVLFVEDDMQFSIVNFQAHSGDLQLMEDFRA
jgi:uncharacterized protein (TIGR02217 family)